MPDGAGQLAQRLGGGVAEDDDVEAGLDEVDDRLGRAGGHVLGSLGPAGEQHERRGIEIDARHAVGSSGFDGDGTGRPRRGGPLRASAVVAVARTGDPELLLRVPCPRRP